MPFKESKASITSTVAFVVTSIGHTGRAFTAQLDSESYFAFAVAFIRRPGRPFTVRLGSEVDSAFVLYINYQRAN